LKGCGDFAWVLHAIASLNPETGRSAMVLPAGVLFREGADGEIRQALIEKDLLEAVITLGPNLAYSTGMPLNILIFRSQKASARKGSVILINGATLFEEEAKRNVINAKHIEQIIGWYQEFKDVPGAVKVISNAEIERNNWNLNIPRYIKPAPGKLLENAIL
jgi:type I restriction enzyme M protein